MLTLTSSCSRTGIEFTSKKKTSCLQCTQQYKQQQFLEAGLFKRALFSKLWFTRFESRPSHQVFLYKLVLLTPVSRLPKLYTACGSMCLFPIATLSPIDSIRTAVTIDNCQTRGILKTRRPLQHSTKLTVAEKVNVIPPAICVSAVQCSVAMNWQAVVRRGTGVSLNQGSKLYQVERRTFLFLSHSRASIPAPFYWMSNPWQALAADWISKSAISWLISLQFSFPIR